jgi:hypothetical protein
MSLALGDMGDDDAARASRERMPLCKRRLLHRRCPQVLNSPGTAT